MNETKEKKEAEAGRVSSSPSALPMTIMKPERRRAENATIRHWMDLGKRALDNLTEMINGQEEISEKPDEEFNPGA